jgi:hypothetical protein
MPPVADGGGNYVDLEQQTLMLVQAATSHQGLNHQTVTAHNSASIVST